ncbi:threonine synthase [Candidatus Micrarchaeota archaeon]|nr:threonine synthase [Candidatus Micrarchaeota archaeon]
MFYCSKCGTEYSAVQYACGKCGSVLLCDYEQRSWLPIGFGVWRYQSMIPVQRSISLNEGGTPLVKRRDTNDNVYLKLEGDNPTGSFKDRGTTVVVSNAFNRKFKRATVASTGNMGASVAAYCAYANIHAKVFIPKDVTQEKIAQIGAYGAELVKVKGTFYDAVQASIREVRDNRTYLAATGLNPYFLEGVKTIGFELFEQMRGVPDKIIVPMGSGGMITAIYKAFLELKKLKRIKTLPQMVGVQATGCSPIATAWEKGSAIVPVHNPKTIASAIMVKVPYNGYTAIDAVNHSKGECVRVNDHQIIQAIKELGREGVFAEPAAAASLAGLKKIDYSKDEKIALIISGSGLKDPTALIRG